MLQADENDEVTHWLIIHVVVWVIFEFIGLYVESVYLAHFQFSMLTITSAN